MAEIQIPTSALDFEALDSALSSILVNYDSWKGYLPTQTGTTLKNFVAAIGASINTKAIRYHQDNFNETAVSDRALYSIADMQGVRLSRKQPTSISVQVSYTRPNISAPFTAAVPQFSQFQGGGTYWYSRDALTIDTGNTATLTLHQGYIVDQTLNGLGTDYQIFLSPEKDFQVSNTDVYVFVNGTQWERTTGGLWNKAGVNAFTDRTSPDGRLKIQFGNINYGGVVNTSDVLRIVYAVTSGADANSLSMLTTKINQINNQVSGLSLAVLSNPSGGAAQVSPVGFKQVGAVSFGTFDSAVTKSQYLEIVTNYPGVVDALTVAQREIDPSHVTFMNVIQVILVTDTVWSAPEKQAYLDYLYAATMYVPHFVLSSATQLASSVVARIYCFNWANLGQCEADATAAVQALFQLKPGVLSHDIPLSDIDGAIKASNKGIDYVDLLSPTHNLVVSSTPALAPVASVSTGGTLAAGSYSYSIAVQTPTGVIAPKNWVTVTALSGSSKIQLTWDPYPGAVNYLVYGRSGTPGYGLLATVASTSTSWLDTGAAGVGAAPPVANTTPIAYNTLSSVTIMASNSTRGTRNVG